MTTTLVYGLAISGQAVARELAARGDRLILADDSIDGSAIESHRSLATEIGAEFFSSPNEKQLREIINKVDRVAPAPGIPEVHQVVTLSHQQNKILLSEIEIAYAIEQSTPSPRPMVAITGTDGKTTTTLMASAIARAAGLKSMAVGNTEVPLIAALGSDAQMFAVECSSFRLEYTQSFRAVASVWLNFAPDHLDWHTSLNSYRAAKAKIWAHLKPTDVAVVPVENSEIEKFAQASSARVVGFGAQRGDYHARDGVLTSPHGPIMKVSQMRRSLPHDVTNALAACAITIEAGLATPADAANALSEFVNAPHRIELVASNEGVSWYNDSKATSPHASRVALQSFDSIVLIAGGKNKGLQLDEMGCEPTRMRAVVAIGNAAREIETAFSKICEVRRADSMRDAVAIANSLAKSGDAILLSPGCTSYDWYSNYGQRGDDFSNEVRTLLAKLKTSGARS